jgi:hypothetical protein
MQSLDLRFVFGLIKVARDFASEIEPYTLFCGDLNYLFDTGMMLYKIYPSV